MRHTRCSIVRTGCVLLLLAVVASIIAGCGGSVPPHGPPTSKIPKDPRPVTVVAGQATTLDLGGGADLIIPPGAITPGATVSATYQGQPGGSWSDIAPTFAPVKLVTTGAIHGLLTLEFPIPANLITPGVDPAAQFGISTYNPATHSWTPYTSTYDAGRHMVVALIPHFSWWNPFTWDFSALYAAITQGFGQLTGARAGPAQCSGGAPSWVGLLAGISNDNDVAIRACAQAQGNVLDVEIVNNRPYGQVLTYGSSVKWGWHETSGSQSDIALDQFMDLNMTPGELYLPPLGRASVGIYEPAGKYYAAFHIGPTKLTIGADLAFYILGQAVNFIPNFGQCQGPALGNSLSNLAPGSLLGDLLAVADCIEQTLQDAVKSGSLGQDAANKLTTLFGKLERASAVADGIMLVGGFTWKIADLVADWIVNRGTTLGNGFSVLVKSPSQPQPPIPAPQPPTPAPQPAPPTVTPTPQPQPQSTWAETTGGVAHTWTNYMNAGGTEGPSINAYQTVQIACKLTGFKVADGNTWWYRIAQSPWNNQYYVSADAFYNNGQTSGSLQGTPFVDPNVPNC